MHGASPAVERNPNDWKKGLPYMDGIKDCIITRLAVVVLLLLLAVSLDACRSGDGLPDPSSQTYREAVAAFHTGLAAIQAGIEVVAEEKMLRVTALVPQEPAAWANLASAGAAPYGLRTGRPTLAESASASS